MAIVVEDGTGLANADSYISVADADTYVDAVATAARNTVWDALTLANQERALRVATQWLDAEYNTRWKETRSNEGQALDWPRQNIEDIDGFIILSTIVPQPVKDSTVEMALRAMSEDIFLDETNDGRIRSKMSKVGPLATRTEYVGGAGQSKRFPVVQRLLRDLVTGTAVRTIFRR